MCPKRITESELRICTQLTHKPHKSSSVLRQLEYQRAQVWHQIRLPSQMFRATRRNSQMATQNSMDSERPLRHYMQKLETRKLVSMIF